MNPITISAAARYLGCTTKTVRYQLARAEQAAQPFARKHGGTHKKNGKIVGGIWLLYDSDLPALRAWIEQARTSGGFQAGNQLWKKAKNLGRPKIKIPRKKRSNKDLRRSAKKKKRNQ